MNSNYTTIKNTHFQKFIKVQASYGIAQRGGVLYPSIEMKHSNRLVQDVNILSSIENKQLIFS